MISSVEVVEEAAKLIKQIRFSANRPAYTEGEHVAVSVDPRWSSNNRTIDVFITCYALGHQDVDWEGLRINIERREDERSVTWLSFLNARGQSTRNQLPVEGEYSLSLPYRVKSHVAERVLCIPQRKIRTRGDMGWVYGTENTKQQSDGADEEALSTPTVREGQSPDGSVRWRVEETDKEAMQVSFEISEEHPSRLIAFSLVDSDSGRVQHSGTLTLVQSTMPGKWEGRVLLGSSTRLKPPSDLVFELLLPPETESQ